MPKPERLDGTGSCELAALLVTLGFEPADRQMTIATGAGIPGGRVGHWRFLPDHPAGRYSLKMVLKYGVRAWLHAGSGLGAPYAEAVWISAAFHNYRLLVEHVVRGVPLEFVRGGTVMPGSPAGEFFVLRRRECRQSDVTINDVRAAGTRRTELAAALVTLGFRPVDGGGTVIAGPGGVVWQFAGRSETGAWMLSERMARWADDDWCGTGENVDPVACMADAFWNLRHLRRGLRDAQVYVRAQNGRRSVLVRQDAAGRVWQQAARFLMRR